MKLTVHTTDDGDLVATLTAYKPELLDADRAADHFYEAVLAALGGHGPDDEPGQRDEPADATARTTSPASATSPPTPRPPDPATVQREALRRLDAGEDATAIAADLGVTAGQIRRWDDDPSIDAYRDHMAGGLLT